MVDVSPYSQALYEIAQTNDQSEEVMDRLEELAGIWKSNPELVQFLKHPKVTRVKKQEVLDTVFKQELDPLIYRFNQVLVMHDVSAYIPEILLAYRENYYKDHQIEVVNVTSASELDEQQMKALKALLTQKLKKNVELLINTDKSLIAGLRVQTSQFVLDNTIVSRAEAMKERMKRG